MIFKYLHHFPNIEWLSKFVGFWAATGIKLFSLKHRLHSECAAPRYFPVLWKLSLTL